MEKVKELSDISWLVDEPTYRADPALSYSTISTYESLGFNGLDHLFDKKESPSLLLGSMVDTIITGSQDEFYKLYHVADFPPTGDKETQIVNYLFNQFSGSYNSMEAIPATYILNAANVYEFQKNWRDDTRVKVLTERGSGLYSLKYDAGDKTVVDLETYEKAVACVKALREFPSTKAYFAQNNPNSKVKRYYQLKFKEVFDNVEYRCMADLLICNSETKKVYPVDLKTSLSCAEWDFEQNFTKWHYFIQGRLYWKIIRSNMDKDDYFKDFSLENYRFIIVNPKTLTPLVWEFPLTKVSGTLIDDRGNEIRDPLEVGKELRFYLDNRPQVPNGINLEGVNAIKCLKVKDEE